MIDYILPFLILIMIVVFIHEYGHYYFAKRYGVAVTDFSIGFGKEIFGWNDKSGTRWKICWIPLGGYVKFFGDRNVFSQADQEKLIEKYNEEDRKKLFVLKPLYQRALIVFGGPLANFLLALLIFFSIYTFAGKDFTPAMINEVQKDSPAMIGGLKQNDIILEIDGNEVKSIMDVSKFITLSTDDFIDFKVKRSYDEILLKVKPKMVLSDIEFLKSLPRREIICGYGEIFKSIDSAIVTKNALAITISKGDSLYIHSDTLTITGPDESKILKGYYDVRIFKSDVRGRSDSIHYNQTSGLIKLLKKPLSQTIVRNLTDEEKNKKNPVVWFGKNQLTGDEIFLKSNIKTQELDSLLISGNVFMIQKDSISSDGYNQIKGEKLEGSFYDGKLKNINVIKNSIILYYMHSDDGEDFLGLNKTLASSILIKFADNEISEVSFYKTPDGNIFSENNIIPNENLKIVK